MEDTFDQQIENAIAVQLRHRSRRRTWAQVKIQSKWKTEIAWENFCLSISLIECSVELQRLIPKHYCSSSRAPRAACNTRCPMRFSRVPSESRRSKRAFHRTLWVRPSITCDAVLDDDGVQRASRWSRRRR